MKRHLNLFFIAFLSLFIFSFSFADSESSSLYNKKSDFLPVDKAFKFKIYSSKDLKQLDIKFKIATDYYLYKNKIDIKIDPILNFDLIKDNGEIKEDEFFGKQEVFYNDTTIKIIPKAPLSKRYQIILQYQGCSEKGLCYPPVTKIIDSSNIKSYSSGVTNSETDILISKLSDQSFILTLLGFFLSGLLLSLTPCVLPMVPILSGIIISSNPKNSIRLTLSYVAGITFTYTLLGIIAGLTGTLLSSSLQNTNFILFAGFLYFIFAIAMFGLFELTLPPKIQNKITNFLQSFKLENSLNVFVLGLISSLILSPCVAPPLAAAILYIGKSSDLILGGASLFFMSLGMSAPLLAIGIFSTKITPKPGPWMIIIKRLLGFILLAMAIYITRPLLSELVFFYSLFLILIVSIVFIIWSNKKNKMKTKVILTIIGLTMIGLIIFQMKPMWINSNHESKQKFTLINNIAELKNFLTDTNKKPIMLDFYADWCVACLEYEKFTFNNPNVSNLLSDFELLQVDVTDNKKEHQLLLKEFDLFGPPGIIFFDSEGEEIKELRTIGFKNATEFSSILLRIKK
ncbi:protein-disulfide reductase DsbD [Methylophilaceae bacterium]|nr:protein-disulfide reductase DsbD [Methylophilaceae bacterium]|tara:strand:- start:1651 stop:3360 length:1710 start_codon:yes stop_codon:yes gene_type:complete